MCRLPQRPTPARSHRRRHCSEVFRESSKKSMDQLIGYASTLDRRAFVHHNTLAAPATRLQARFSIEPMPSLAHDSRFGHQDLARLASERLSRNVYLDPYWHCGPIRSMICLTRENPDRITGGQAPMVVGQQLPNSISNVSILPITTFFPVCTKRNDVESSLFTWRSILKFTPPRIDKYLAILEIWAIPVTCSCRRRN